MRKFQPRNDWATLQEEIDQAISGLFAGITPGSLLEDVSVEEFDGPSLDEALENGPWRDLWSEGHENQGVAAQPDDW
jgi:hypothetical protein